MNSQYIENGIRTLDNKEIEMISGGNRFLIDAFKKLFEIFATETATEWVRNGGIGRLGSSIHNSVMSTGGAAVSGLVRMQDQDFPENP